MWRGAEGEWGRMTARVAGKAKRDRHVTLPRVNNISSPRHATAESEISSQRSGCDRQE